MRTIDLNCDLGEGFPNDAELIGLVNSVNIACGGHAGDDDSMRTAVRLAKAAGVQIGAHPSYDDREGFGRRAMELTPHVVRSAVERQVRRLREIAAGEGATLAHVKPHGALYHAAATDAKTAAAVIGAIAAIDPALTVVGPPLSLMETAAMLAGLRFVAEGFVDRRYQANGTLVPRGEVNAVITDVAAAVAQAIGLIERSEVTTAAGERVPLRVQTLCVHGDGEHAVGVLQALRIRLIEDGITVAPPMTELQTD